MRRILLLVYLHDALMPVFHNVPPSFGESELDLRLPCDDELWEAPDPHRWAQLVAPHASSPSAPIWPANLRASLRGESLCTVVTAMLNPLSTAPPVPLNRFASFVVIHALLRAIHLTHGNDFEERLSIQHALTQWYVSRLSAASGSGNSQSPSNVRLNFTSTALPLYWLAQLSHGDTSGQVRPVGQARFRTMKGWLKDFWLVLRDAGEVAVGVGLAGLPDPAAGTAFVEEMSNSQEANNEADAGLLEWIPR
jgi:hypothetical protein